MELKVAVGRRFTCEIRWNIIVSNLGKETDEIVWTQILQGLGGGFASISAQVGAQASVTHSDIATVTAAVLLLTEIGGAIGTAIGTFTH